jgi:hypothetical protein
LLDRIAGWNELLHLKLSISEWPSARETTPAASSDCEILAVWPLGGGVEHPRVPPEI